MDQILLYAEMTVTVMFAVLVVVNFLCLCYGVFNGCFPATVQYLYRWLCNGYYWSIPVFAIGTLLATLMYAHMGLFFSLLSVLATSAIVGMMSWLDIPNEVAV